MRERNVSRNADVSVCALCNSCGRRNEQSGIDMIDARWIIDTFIRSSCNGLYKFSEVEGESFEPS